MNKLSLGVQAARSFTLLDLEVAIMAGRLAALLRDCFADDISPVTNALSFLNYRYRQVCGDHPLAHWSATTEHRLSQCPGHPLLRLQQALELPETALEFMIFVGMAEDHEGFADVFRSLHPSGQPRPTVGLAAQLLAPDPEQRRELRSLLEAGRAAKLGLFVLLDDSPLFASGICLAEKVWARLSGSDGWPLAIAQCCDPPERSGLAEWFESEETSIAGRLLQQSKPASIYIRSESSELGTARAVALVAEMDLRCVVISGIAHDVQAQRLAQLHCLMRALVPILVVDQSKSDTPLASWIAFADYPGPWIQCGPGADVFTPPQRPVISLPFEPLSAPQLRQMWQQLLPELSAQAGELAARFPMEPTQAKTIVGDLTHRRESKAKALSVQCVAQAVRARAASTVNSAVELIRPKSDWSHLVLPSESLKQLRDAVERLRLQAKVLDDWQFLQGRRGARGVRMLFAGPSGTGKTLSAEVVANALDVDLLQVDLSRVVSKWIGETEKNLAQVFACAESARAVLFFDEADSLFGKRTEVSDANDRYANLETSYLLSRLERFEGLAILATNYRQNIDAAFSRRLEFIVEFSEPAVAQRQQLWQRHIPASAPCNSNVNSAELAELFPIVGGHIRNAAVAAAFLAAGENSPIDRRHLLEAIRREYEKSGKAFREVTV